MPNFKRRLLHALCITLAVFFCIPVPVYANPYPYLDGSVTAVTGIFSSLMVRFIADNTNVTAVQTVLHFDPQLVSISHLSTAGSYCSFWAPADPSLGYGNNATPYVVGGNKIVLSCGFSNPGYRSQNGNGDRLLSLILRPIASGSAIFSFSNTQLRYVGSLVAPSESPEFELRTYGSTIDAQLYGPTPSPSPSPTPATTSATPTPTPQPSVTTLRASDLNFVNVRASGSGATSQTTGASASFTDQNPDVVTEDNSIPPPPNMSPRPNSTPFVNQTSTMSALPEGEVLSLQSLRELLIPGKSSADRTLVVFNLITTLTFVTLLAILVWRLVTSSRTNKLKYSHINELLEGEIAVIESKLEGTRLKDGSVDESAGRTLEQLKHELQQHST